MSYLLMLAQIRRMPALIGSLQDALHERAAGSANAADEIAAIRKAATWEGKGGDAAMNALGRSVLSFDRAQSDDRSVATAVDGVRARADAVVQKIAALAQEAKAAHFTLNEAENRLEAGLDTRTMSQEDRRAYIDKHAELQAKLEAIRREGEEVDLDFGRVIATATGGADSSSELTPIAQEGKTVLKSAPPEGVLDGTGYWVIDPALGQDTPTRPASTPGPYSYSTDPNFKLNVGPTSDFGYPARNWSSAPLGEYMESYRFRITGTEFTGQTKMVQVDGKWYQAEWQNYKYEYKQNQNIHLNPDSAPIKEMPVQSQWRPISMAGIVDISHRLPDTKIWLPDTCGGKVTLVDGNVAGPNFKMPPVMYAPHN
ncbi:outer membrane murein-binding lipoprotein Lpp [Mycobacteroides chelonae]|nr:outer membrane murein-binding lipoprotein Lpp [Mycobacteroides chelonae]